MTRDDVVDTIRELWLHSLRRDTVAMDQSFFAMGGNSMAAVRMLASVISRFGVDLDLPRFFAEPTIATLADLLCEASPSPGMTETERSG